MTGVQFSTPEQHLSMKHVHSSTLSRNSNDMNQMMKFCKSRYLIDAMSRFDGSLNNIASGLVAPQNVSITEVKNFGLDILSKMATNSPCTYTFNKKMQAVPIPSKQEQSKPNHIQIDSGLFFQRILSTCSNYPQDLSKAFSYELAHHPQSLCDDGGFLRYPSKHELGNLIHSEYLLHDVHPDFTSWDFVVDGGLLLYTVPWNKGFTHDQIIDNYVNYIRNIGTNMHIIFDGYLQSNTKDHTHERRNPLKSFRVGFSRDMLLVCSREFFLSNPENKQQFINMLGGVLTVSGFDVKYCINDADTMIVEKSLDILNWNNVVLIADDSDIFVLLITQLKGDLGQHCLYLKQQASKRMINISSLINCIPLEKKNTLLLYHAMSGCDTTSSLFDHGKTKLYKKGVLEKHPELSHVFYTSTSTREDIIRTGEKILAIMYGGEGQSLDELRYKRYREKLYKSGSVQKGIDARRLPPTSWSATYHCLRVFHQVQEWLRTNLDPVVYGWEKKMGNCHRKLPMWLLRQIML